MGRVKVACSVYGPRQQANAPYHEVAQLNCHVRFLPASSGKIYANSSDLEDESSGSNAFVQERDMGQRIAAAVEPSVMLHLFPKSNIDVYIEVFEAANFLSCLAAGINAAAIAIADAGIDCVDMVSAASGIYKDGHCLVDVLSASLHNTQDVELQAVVAYMAARSQLTEVYLNTPRWTSESSLGDHPDRNSQAIGSLLPACIERATDVRLVMNKALKDALDSV